MWDRELEFYSGYVKFEMLIIMDMEMLGMQLHIEV